MADVVKDQPDSQLTFTKKVWIAASIVAAMVILLLLFKTLFSLLLLILAGVLVSIYFYGVAGLMQRLFHCPPKLSLALSILLNIVLAVAFFWYIGATLQQQIAQLSSTLPQTLQGARDKISQSPIGKKMLDQLSATGDTQKTIGTIQQFFSSSFGILSDVYIVILLSAFFTAGPALYKRGMIRLLPTGAKQKGEALINKISEMLKKWIKAQVIGIFFIGILTSIGLVIMQMPLVLTLSIMAGLLSFIPNFGPIIALVPAVLLSLGHGTTRALVIIAMYLLIQLIQSVVVGPIIQKKMIDLPPALTIIGQLAMGAIAGFWGVLLATPIVAIVIILVNDLYIERQQN